MSPKRHRGCHPPPPTTPSMRHVTQTTQQTLSTTHHDAVYAPCHPNDVAGAVHDHPQRCARAMSPKRHHGRHPPPPTTPSTCHVTQTTPQMPSTTPHDAVYAPPPPTTPSMRHVTKTMSLAPSMTTHNALYAPCHPNDITHAIHHPPTPFMCLVTQMTP